MPRQTKSSAKTATCTCLVCGRAFRRNYELNRHLATHAPNVDELKAQCPYEGCSFKTLQQSNLKTHIIARHLKLKPHKCTVGNCTSAFADMACLIRHEKNVHDYRRKRTSAVPKYSRKALPVVKLEEELIDLTMLNSDCSTPGLSDASSSSGSQTPFPQSPFTPEALIPDQSLYQQRAHALEEANLYLASNFLNLYPEDLSRWSSQQSLSSAPDVLCDPLLISAGSGASVSFSESGPNSLDWMNEMISSSPSNSLSYPIVSTPAAHEMFDGWASF